MKRDHELLIFAVLSFAVLDPASTYLPFAPEFVKNCDVSVAVRLGTQAWLMLAGKLLMLGGVWLLLRSRQDLRAKVLFVIATFGLWAAASNFAGAWHWLGGVPLGAAAVITGLMLDRHFISGRSVGGVSEKR